MTLRTPHTPLVSVVMSVFNGEMYLSEAIRSILVQSFEDFEFLIVDDGSTDGTRSILHHFSQRDQRIIILTQENSGLVDALNRACLQANGKYIARMDADDIAAPTRLALQVSFMEANPNVGSVGADVDFIDLNDNVIEVSKHPYYSNKDIQNALLENNVIWHPTVLIRRSIFVSVGGYRKIKDAEDYDLWLRIAECSELNNLPDRLLRYRIHSAQVSTANRGRQIIGAITAQLSAIARRNGNPDPFDATAEPSFQTLQKMGLEERRLHTIVAKGYLSWLRNLCLSREYGVAIETFNSLLSSNCRYAERWVVAESYRFAATAFWHRRQLIKSISALSHALVTYPVMIGRPLKGIMRSIKRSEVTS